MRQTPVLRTAASTDAVSRVGTPPIVDNSLPPCPRPPRPLLLAMYAVPSCVSAGRGMNYVLCGTRLQPSSPSEAPILLDASPKASIHLHVLFGASCADVAYPPGKREGPP